MRIAQRSMFLFLAALVVLAAAGGAQGGDDPPAKTTDAGATESPAGQEPGAAESSASPEAESPKGAESAAADADDAEDEGEAAEKTAGRSAEKAEGDVEWLVDESTGRRYQIVTVARTTRGWERIDEKTIVVTGGLRFELLDEDEDNLYLKVWEVKLPTKWGPRDTGPTDEEKQAVAASYDFDLPEVDALELRSFDQGLPRSGQWRNGFTLTDLNGDGALDIAFGPTRKGAPRPNLFLGDGEGSWRQWRESSFPSLPLDYGDTAAGDLDGDGHVDLVFGVHLRGLIALRGDGEGGFTTWGEGLGYEVPGQGGDATTFSSRSVELLDVDRDGRLDIVALGEGPKGLRSTAKGLSGTIVNTARGLVVYRNEGDGSWTPASLVRSQDFGDDFAVADFDGDGRPDYATATRIVGNKAILVVSNSGEWSTAALEELRPMAILGGIDAADFDGDGRADLALSYGSRELDVWRTGVDVYLSRPGLRWERRAVLSQEGRLAFTALAAGEVDGTGGLDLVVATDDGRVLVLLGDGKGGFSREAAPELPEAKAGCDASAVRLADADRDGRAEIFVAFAGESSLSLSVQNQRMPGCPGGGSLKAWKPVPR